MINRGNWQIYKEYLLYRQEVDQVSQKTVRNEETWLRHMIEWANEKPLQKAVKIRPTFPNYLLEARSDGKEKPLSSSYIEKVIRASYRFITWITTHKRGYNELSRYYLDTLKAPKIDEMPNEKEHVSLDEILAIAHTEVRTPKEKRMRAAAVFLFLSGMRVSAFASLPLMAVDLYKLEIRQWPSLGVRTKNSKYGTTTFLDIPELLETVREWDREIRAILPPKGLWFSPLLPSTGEIDCQASVDTIGKNRGRNVTKNLRDWLLDNKLPYHSPHKFRHGHAFYYKKHARDYGDIEALKENLMHSSIQTTDSIYGIFGKKDIKEHYLSLHDTKEINLLEEIPPQDRQFILDIYKIYKQKGSD